ncbi:MAG: PIN domain-containing protein [Verrucomicrobia bacterium]|nr:MAG: PIN domain-containing protein [Verrucomicrobiota bacterium]
MVFFDTNIFVYAVSAAEEDQEKQRIARAMLANEEFALSHQVVQEFINTCLNKLRLGQSREAIAETAELLLAYPCLGSSHGQIRHAFALQERYKISYWDAAVLAAAIELGCSILYTEDLNHSQTYDSIQVINPFV